ncbi:MAG: nucleotidyl transferase AbiEii/AbiGii toxin family protein [Bacteroidota bacterium]|nr:nucleotidyl transferase AbiEii/AbiGii toxin family protein [Bacteroidota bacterium]
MPQKTARVFNVLAQQSFISKYTLVGGTALSLQVGHRLSEDLDFVMDEEQINANTIKRNIAKLFPGFRIIRQDNGWQIDFVVEEVKLTFFSAGAVGINFDVQKHAFAYQKMRICDIETIASLKMATIAQRNTIRDYYDLYIIVKNHVFLKDIIGKTKSLMPELSPITYTETLVYANDIEEESIAMHLSPAEIVTKNQIADFFIRELRKIKNEI